MDCQCTSWEVFLIKKQQVIHFIGWFDSSATNYDLPFYQNPPVFNKLSAGLNMHG